MEQQPIFPNDEQTDVQSLYCVQTDSPSVAPKVHRAFQEAYGWLETFAVTLLVLVAIVAFLGRYAPVDGSSMSPTLTNGDLVVISQVGYTPAQGDVVVVQSKSYGYDRPLVKRIIATGGQTVTIDYDFWQITVDGTVLQEPYVLRGYGPMETGDQPKGIHTFTVPQGKLFVMGDNRNGSCDSRYRIVGYIDERLVVGKVLFRLFPFSAFGTID